MAEMLKGQIELANSQSISVAPWAVRSSLAASYRQALSHVARLRGEGSQLSTSTIARSNIFRVYRDAILEVLRKHPQALIAVRDKIAELEGEGR